MIKCTLIILLLSFFVGCSSNQLPEGVLKKEKMQLVLWDVIQAGAFTDNFIKQDSTKNFLLENANIQQQIFAMHKITKDDFYKSYDYYKSHPDLMKVLLDSITQRDNRYYLNVNPAN